MDPELGLKLSKNSKRKIYFIFNTKMLFNYEYSLDIHIHVRPTWTEITKDNLAMKHFIQMLQKIQENAEIERNIHISLMIGS